MQVIQWFWKTLHEFDGELLTRMVQMLFDAPTPPSAGPEQHVLTITDQQVIDSSADAAPCAREGVLQLPLYPDQTDLAYHLTFALLSQQPTVEVSGKWGKKGIQRLSECEDLIA